jgi:N-methylhydantoinase B/oxoprolinase/acetone carboxylase alpha subunit
MGCKMPWWAGSENPPPDKDKIISDLRAEVASLKEERDRLQDTYGQNMWRIDDLTQQLAAAKEYAARVHVVELAAQAVIDRWYSPDWMDGTHTQDYIVRLRAALSNLNEDRDRKA